MTIDLPIEAWKDIVKALRSGDNMTNEGLANMIDELTSIAESGTIRCKDVGDLTMNELAARGCETEKARKAFVESEGL